MISVMRPRRAWVNRAAIEMIDSRNSAHLASEAKQKAKRLISCGWSPITLPPQLDPGVAVEGGGLLADANQQFRRFPSRLEQPE